MKKIRRYIEFVINYIRNYIWSLVFGKNYYEKIHRPQTFQYPSSTTSQLCTSSLYELPFFGYWTNKLKEPIRYHRKQWELVYICQTLHEHGLLNKDKKGLVFGCGKEPLISLFASLDCKITATDLDVNDNKAEVWTNTSQHIKNDFYELNSYNICNKEKFIQNVTFRTVDMNNIPDDLRDYDFCWSCSSLEHIGSLNSGLNFIKNSLKTLKKGGIAIHITEFNLSSNDKTHESYDNAFYREKDIRRLISELEEDGHYVYPLVLDRGNCIADKFIDKIPYEKTSVHLKLRANRYDITSIGLIIKK